MRKKHSTWILIADATRARVFQLQNSGKSVAATWEQEHVGSSLASRDIASDRPGRTFDRAGEGRHAKEPPTDPARYEKERFAREVAQKLDDDRKHHNFDELIVVAPPQFLGDLRGAMSVQLKGCVSKEVNKDFSKMKPTEILEHLKDTV